MGLWQNLIAALTVAFLALLLVGWHHVASITADAEAGGRSDDAPTPATSETGRAAGVEEGEATVDRQHAAQPFTGAHRGHRSRLDAGEDEGRDGDVLMDREPGLAAQPAVGHGVGVSAAGIPLYPESIGKYRHTYGTCGVAGSSVHPGANNSRMHALTVGTQVINGTLQWPQFPDRRLEFPTEHERCHAAMVRVLAIFAAVMKELRMDKWFVSHGTLLGAVRHGGMIPWDVDIDVVMPRSHVTLLRKVWRKYYPRDMFLQSERTESSFHMWIGKERAMRIKDRYSSFVGMKFGMTRRGKRYRMKPWHLGAGVDVIPLERKGKGVFKLLHHYLPYDMIWPLRTVCFENLVLPAPNNISGFLTALYGPNYMTAPPNITFTEATALPCHSTRPSQHSKWSLHFASDHAPNKTPVTWPRGDPWGSYAADFREPYTHNFDKKGNPINVD